VGFREEWLMIENNVVRHLVEYARRAYTRGLLGGTGGNFSARTDQGRMVITASGLSLGDTAADNLIEMDLDSLAWQPNGDLLPSKEFHFHADILRRRPEINAVLHVHPPHVTAFSVLKRDIPMLTDAAFKQPPIPRVPFAPSGSRELQANVAEALDNRTARPDRARSGHTDSLRRRRSDRGTGPDRFPAARLGGVVSEGF